MTKERKEQLIKEYGRNGQDTGSVEVQLALLTERKFTYFINKFSFISSNIKMFVSNFLPYL